MMAAGNNCRLLAFYFPVQIWYMFFISKCKGESELGTCKEDAAAQWRLPTNLAAKHVLKLEVGTAQPHALYKSLTHAQT